MCVYVSSSHLYILFRDGKHTPPVTWGQFAKPGFDPAETLTFLCRYHVWFYDSIFLFNLHQISFGKHDIRELLSFVTMCDVSFIHY